jgi:hypothetical protein
MTIHNIGIEDAMNGMKWKLGYWLSLRLGLSHVGNGEGIPLRRLAFWSRSLQPIILGDKHLGLSAFRLRWIMN